MTYTILSAAFANADHSAAVLQTQEAGAVLASAQDTPDLWEDMLEAVTPAAYAVPSPKPEVMAELRTLREDIYKPLDRMQMRALSTEDALKQEVEACKESLRNLPQTVDPLLLPGMTREEMRATVKAQYKALAAATPAHVRVAFKVLA